MPPAMACANVLLEGRIGGVKGNGVRVCDASGNLLPTQLPAQYKLYWEHLCVGKTDR